MFTTNGASLVSLAFIIKLVPSCSDDVTKFAEIRYILKLYLQKYRYVKIEHIRKRHRNQFKTSECGRVSIGSKRYCGNL